MRVLPSPKPPRGLSRILFRLPIQFYRMRLGWMLGGRFLLLTHTGRRSGQPRRTVIEVVEHDRRTRSYVVCSGFGVKSDWYQNVIKNPRVTIGVGRRSVEAVAHRLAPEEGGEVMARYAPRHPVAARKLVRFMGFEVDGSMADYREVGLRLPFVRFTETST